MKNKKLMTILIALVAGPLMAKESVNVKVNGMVCSFCSQGIKKKFESEKAVEKVEVNLDEKWVKLDLKDNQKLEDDKIKSLITEAGYNTVSIERKVASE